MNPQQTRNAMENDIHMAKVEPIQREHMAEVIMLLQNMSAYLPAEDSYDAIWDVFAAQPNVFSVVAIENEMVVGYGSVVIESKIRGGKMGHVEDIVTHPDRLNKGIGKSVVNSLYEIARSKGCYKVSLQCQQHNIPFYEKCDYKVSGSAMQRFIAN